MSQFCTHRHNFIHMWRNVVLHGAAHINGSNKITLLWLLCKYANHVAERAPAVRQHLTAAVETVERDAGPEAREVAAKVDRTYKRMASAAGQVAGAAKETAADAAAAAKRMTEDITARSASASAGSSGLDFSAHGLQEELDLPIGIGKPQLQYVAVVSDSSVSSPVPQAVYSLRRPTDVDVRFVDADSFKRQM